jgi:pimeloyl-ACP methyl ester carboxylesterase
MVWDQKSTIVRFRNDAMKAFFRYGEHVAPRRVGGAAFHLWFSAPPRMAELPLPDGGEPFEVLAQGHVVRGFVWGDGATVYLVHGWGGRGSQFGALVEPLVEAGYRVVMFDAPAHGGSDHGPWGPRRTNGVEFAKALDAVFCRFGPAEAVVAHSMGTISTYLAMRFGWLGATRLVFVAPMVEFASLLDQFQQALGFGPRSRRVMERMVDRSIGIPVHEFDARIQASHVEPRPTLVITDRDDRQTPYAEVVDFAETIGAPLITTEGLGHRKVLRDPEVVKTVVEFLGGYEVRSDEQASVG